MDQPHQTRSPFKIHMVEVHEKNNPPIQFDLQRDQLFIEYDPKRRIDHISFLDALPPNHPFDWCIEVTAVDDVCRVRNQGRNTWVREIGDHRKERVEFRPGQDITVAFGERLTLDNLNFVFHRRRIAESFAVKLNLPDRRLLKEHIKFNPLLGEILLHNKGDQTTVQFHLALTVEGVHLPACHVDSSHVKLVDTPRHRVTCYFYHPSSKEPLPAGKYRVGVKVRPANDEYPGELATDYEVIEVVPFYDHAIEALDPDQCGTLLSNGDGT